MTCVKGSDALKRNFDAFPRFTWCDFIVSSPFVILSLAKDMNPFTASDAGVDIGKVAAYSSLVSNSNALRIVCFNSCSITGLMKDSNHMTSCCSNRWYSLYDVHEKSCIYFFNNHFFFFDYFIFTWIVAQIIGKTLHHHNNELKLSSLIFLKWISCHKLKNRDKQHHWDCWEDNQCIWYRNLWIKWLFRRGANLWGYLWCRGSMRRRVCWSGWWV